MSKERIETVKLSEQEIKMIKYGKRIGYIFSGLILAFGALFNLTFLVSSADIEESRMMLLLIDIGILGLSILTAYFMNRKYNKDLAEETVKIEVEEVQSKSTETSHEAGSGSMYIPILGNLFPKYWGQEMIANQKYYLVVDGYRKAIEKELYDIVEKGDLVEFRYSKYSEILLGTRKLEK